jgi:hypothetical protein
MAQEDYESGFEEYIAGGLREETERRYRCAVDLYYKAMCQVIDYLLFVQGVDVTRLKDRLDNVKLLNSDLHTIFSISHSIYRSAYKKNKDKTDCREIKNGIKKIIFLKHLEGRFKEITEKI